MPFRQRHCLPLHFANTSQWKRRRRIGKAAAATDRHHLPLLLLLLPLIVLLGRTEGRDALRPDIELEAVDDATREAELLIEEAVADAGGETAAEEEADGGKKSDGKSAGRVGPAPFAHWHFSAAAALGHYSPDFFFIGAPSVQAHISRHSWERYQRFKEETCRKSAETDMAERRLNSTESAYFHWEENEFHRELRKKLLPQTMRDGRTSFRALLSSDLLGSLDPRLFVSAPKSLCKAKRLVDEADERLKQVKEEKHMFEDFLINKVFSPTV
ncbi:hypothetical protein niasHS_003310 [Heterodera schachtii]|uniref:Uncharacterized protein n=1 Tax=Heterodera schachtii TaxID=97005 RepID=A0ABD2KG75_HETSC